MLRMVLDRGILLRRRGGNSGTAEETRIRMAMGHLLVSCRWVGHSLVRTRSLICLRSHSVAVADLAIVMQSVSFLLSVQKELNLRRD